MTQYVKTLEVLGIDPVVEHVLHAFARLFARWNTSINLSAARSEAEISAQIIDSLHVVPHLAPAARALDVGSGGGFPVVITSICCPDIDFVSLEPTRKKHAFLRTAARELELPNLDARAVRIEDHPIFDYDVAMSRATFDLQDWLRIGGEHVRPGGRVIGFEGLERADLGVVERISYDLDGKHRAIIIAKH